MYSLRPKLATVILIAKMKSICVYCGSSTGSNPAFSLEAEELGKVLAKQNITLVYGGGSVGLMGIIADTVLNNGGKVIGVIPRFLKAKEVGHDGLTELVLVDSMHERKLRMSELAEAFLAMPGGFGTLEELAEILTWIQLGLLQKPVGILNVDHFFDHLIAQFDHMVDQELLKKANRDLLMADNTALGLVQKMRDYRPISVEKWIGPKQT